jgi:hypothetical protein
VLATTAALGQVEQDGSDYWRLSPAGWKEVAAEVWAGHDFTIEGHGNCVTAMAALLGLALEELRQGELDAQDGRYPVLVTLFCRKIGPR